MWIGIRNPRGYGAVAMRHARIAAKVDDNQKQVEAALKAVGAWYQSVGQPYDLLVNFRDKWYVMEVKDGNKPMSKQHLTDAQLRTLADLKCQGVSLVRTPDEALCVIGMKKWEDIGK